METGRTSSVSQQIMGFTSTGKVTNHKDIDLDRSLSWGEIVKEAAKVVTFFDLAGHEKYLKTTVAGMIGPSPDYCMLMLGANMGVQRMTKEHLGLAVNLALPAFVVRAPPPLFPRGSFSSQSGAENASSPNLR